MINSVVRILKARYWVQWTSGDWVTDNINQHDLSMYIEGESFHSPPCKEVEKPDNINFFSHKTSSIEIESGIANTTIFKFSDAENVIFGGITMFLIKFC